MSKHPWFPAKQPVFLTISRVYNDSRGKALPARLVASKIIPTDITDEGQVKELYGPGRYSVTGRALNGQLCGQPHVFDVPDEFGRVPMLDEEDDRGASGAGAVGWKDLLRAAEKRGDDMQRLFTSALEGVRKDRAADLQFFSAAVESMAKAIGGAGQGGGGGASDAFLQKRLDYLEKELREERSRGREWETKYIRKSVDEDTLDKLIDKGPALWSMFKGGSGGGALEDEKRQLLAEFEKVKKLRERLSGELDRAEKARKALEERAAGAAGAEAPQAARDLRAELLAVDPADFDSLLGEGKKLSDEVVEAVKGLDAEGRLPAGLREVLTKHKVI